MINSKYNDVNVTSFFLTSFSPSQLGNMWLVAVSIPLLPVVLVASTVYGAKVAALCRRLLSWLQRLTRGKVCVRSTHAYVFTNCTHGKVVSVLETFDLYNRTHPNLCVSPQAGQYSIGLVWVAVAFQENHPGVVD